MSEQKILLISGKKQSGKDSAANFLAGYLLRQQGMIKYFELDEEGKLLVDIKVQDPQTGNVVEELGLHDLGRKDTEYVNWASNNLWPIIKIDHFGDALKDICEIIFGLDRAKLYGTDKDKNELTHIKWADIYKLCPEHMPKEDYEVAGKEFATYREILQVFGTDICRTLFSECWIQSLMKIVVLQGYPFVVIPDCRNEDEINYCRALGAKVIRLTRDIYPTTHSIEAALDDYQGYDAVIDNQNMTQEEKGVELVKILQSWGWVN